MVIVAADETPVAPHHCRNWDLDESGFQSISFRQISVVELRVQLFAAVAFPELSVLLQGEAIEFTASHNDVETILCESLGMEVCSVTLVLSF